MKPDIEIDNSIPNRDLELESELLSKYYDKFINEYIMKIEEANKDKDFERDNSYNGITAPNHIMYKLKNNEKGETTLYCHNDKIGYEFLIEFDKANSGYGIYYGCKGLIKGGNQLEGIKTILDDWQKIEKITKKILNNTYPGRDYNKRFKSTNNANNKTFWPFWISLNDDESLNIAMRNLRIIASAYNHLLNNNINELDKTLENNNSDQKNVSLYTEESFIKTCSECKIQKNDSNIRYDPKKYIESFLDACTREGIIERLAGYEKAWKIIGTKKIGVTEFSYLLVEFCKVVGIVDVWKTFGNLLFSKKGLAATSLKKSYNQGSKTTKYTKDHKERDKEMKQYLEETLRIFSK